MSWFSNLRSAPAPAPKPTAPAGKPKVVTKSRLAGAAGASLLALVTAGALLWEDLRTDAYKDVVGIWTVCIGETKGVQPGMKFTADECRAKFSSRIVEFETDMRRCLAASDALPAKTYGAFMWSALLDLRRLRLATAGGRA